MKTRIIIFFLIVSASKLRTQNFIGVAAEQSVQDLDYGFEHQYFFPHSYTGMRMEFIHSYKHLFLDSYLSIFGQEVKYQYRADTHYSNGAPAWTKK